MHFSLCIVGPVICSDRGPARVGGRACIGKASTIVIMFRIIVGFLKFVYVGSKARFGVMDVNLFTAKFSFSCLWAMFNLNLAWVWKFGFLVLEAVRLEVGVGEGLAGGAGPGLPVSLVGLHQHRLSPILCRVVYIRHLSEPSISD